MRVPLAWIRDYIDLPPDVDAIVAKLATLGFPVDAVEARPHISGVVAGTIVKLHKHPNADRLQVCTLDIGGPALLTIATAATNVAQDQIVPVAVIGAQLPQLKIEPRKMRGIDSQGMLCSAQELGLPAEWFEDGIMQLDAGTPNGTDVVRHFGLDLPVLEVEVTANRGDALCMIGIARELAAAYDLALRFPPTAAASGAAAATTAADVRVTLESLDVRRYVAQRVSNVRVGLGAAAIRVRLALAGQRPISNLVDISNFVMFELGQPLHFFDYDKIGGRHIVVRDASPGERLTTLDGIERELDATALLIADEQRATGLAGLMGGLISEVSDTTREIVIESANFAGPRVRRMSVKLGLRTEASSRNEKNLPPGLTDIAAARAAYLLERDGAHPHPARSYGKPFDPPAAIELAASDVHRLLGFEVSPHEMRRALKSLGFTLQPAAADEAGFHVSVPAWRSDVLIAADLVEEIARIIGYDRVRAELPPVPAQALDSAAFDREMALAQTLAGLGYAECLTLALQPGNVAERWRSIGLDVPAVVEIRNPLSEDQRWMRFSLLPGLLDHAARERALRPLRTFELGHVFADAADAPRETNELTILTVSRPLPDEPAWRDGAFLTAAADVRALVRAVCGIDARLERGSAPGLHPGKTARILAGETAVGFVGTVDPRLLRAHGIGDAVVAAVMSIDALPRRAARPYRAPSKFPAVERDLAIVVDPALAAADVQATIRSATPLARSVAVFDEYRGPQIGTGKKSLAVRIALQSDEATLTDGAADAAIGHIVEALRVAHGATPRG